MCKEIINKRIANKAALVFTTYYRGRLIAVRDRLVRRNDQLQMRAAAEAKIDINSEPPPPSPVTLNAQNNGNNCGGQEDWVEFEQLPIVVNDGPQQNTGGKQKTKWTKLTDGNSFLE